MMPASPINRYSQLVLLGLLGVICSNGGCAPSKNDSNTNTSSVLRLATTTSVRDSGLLEEIIPEFEKEQHCRVDVVAVGTGAALKLGENVDADALVIHAREAELEFMQAKHGIRHEEFMVNYFILIGPKEDPAGIRGKNAVGALQQIVEKKATFVSRGDDSGTHKRERSLWKKAGARPKPTEYIETGQGMGETLTVTDEMLAYTLSDQGTFLNFQKKIDLVPLVTLTEDLRNPYSAIVVNPDKSEKINSKLAEAFVEYLVSEKCQLKINNYRLYGQPAFTPARLSSKPPAKE